MKARSKAAPASVAKARVLLGILCSLALWPVVQRQLVTRFEIDPWKFAGFAMYATWTGTVVVPLEPAPGGGLTPMDETALPAFARDALHRFRRDRPALGKLLPPDELAQTLFAARPEIDGLVVAIQRMQLDPKTARIISTKQTRPFVREKAPESQ